MSNVVSGIVQRRKVGSPTRKAVLMYMAGCASDDGSGVWSSKSNLARDLEMGRRTVQVCIDDLVKSGIISEVGARPCRNGFTTEYCLNMEAIAALEPTRAGDAHVQDVHMTCAGRAQQDVQDVHTNHPITIKEPSIKGKSAKPRQTQIPEDAIITEAMVTAAAKRGHSLQEAEAQFDAFKASAISKARTYANWNMAFVTWLDSPYFKPRTTGGQNGQPTNHGSDRLQRIVSTAARGTSSQDWG